LVAIPQVVVGEFSVPSGASGRAGMSAAGTPRKTKEE